RDVISKRAKNPPRPVYRRERKPSQREHRHLRRRPIELLLPATFEPRARLLLPDHPAKRPAAFVERGSRPSNNFDRRKLRARFGVHLFLLLAPARCSAAQTELIARRSVRWRGQSHPRVPDRAPPYYKERRAVSRDLDTHRPLPRLLEKCPTGRQLRRKFHPALPAIPFARNFPDRTSSGARQPRLCGRARFRSIGVLSRRRPHESHRRYLPT